jgi:hypothetical protein
VKLGRRAQAAKVQRGARVGRAGQQAYRQAHRAVGQALGQWQDTVGATSHTTATDSMMTRVIAKQLEVNARAGQTM